MIDRVKKLRVGIAGYGVIGKLRHREVDLHPRLKVVAVCDQDFTKPSFAISGIKSFVTYQELLAENLDILFVCLPNYLAPLVTVEGLKKGLHVFCEKPPGRNLKDILDVRMVEASHPNLKLMYGFNHRYHDSVRDALQLIQSGELGTIVDMQGIYGKSKIIRFDTNEWRTQRSLAGGGILLDQGIHMLDLMRLFAGEFIDIHSYINNSFWHHDVEDNAYVMMRAENGVVAMLHSSATQWRHRFNLTITLSKGSIILSGILTNSRSYGAETIKVVYASDDDQGDPKEITTRYNQDHSWSDEIREFAECILQDKPITQGSSYEAYKTMELLFRIYSADREWASKYLT